MKYKDQLKTKEWINKRNIILQRDNNKCTKCGSSFNLHVHHLYYEDNKLAWEYLDNALITVCRSCHTLLHKDTLLKNNTERFIITRTTIGLEWIKVFKELLDLQLLMVLVEYQDPKSGISIITKLQIQEISVFFNKNEKTIRNSLSRLISVGALHKIASHNYLVNPLMFYKGGSRNYHKKLNDWNVLKKNKISCKERIDNFENSL